MKSGLRSKDIVRLERERERENRRHDRKRKRHEQTGDTRRWLAERLLRDCSHGRLSNAVIARRCRIPCELVAQIRSELCRNTRGPVAQNSKETT